MEHGAAVDQCEGTQEVLMARHGAPLCYTENDRSGTRLSHSASYPTEQVTQSVKAELIEIDRAAVNHLISNENHDDSRDTA